MNYNWNWGVFWQAAPDGSGTYFGWLLSGLGWTLSTALLAWAIALTLGAAVGTLRTTPLKWVVRAGNAYVELFRNVPLLVQMFLWYFVLPELLPRAMGDALKQITPPWGSFWLAVLCLGFYTSARVAEQTRAGIQSLPRGQAMAATALGLALPQTYRFVLLPQAFRIMLPPLTSEFMNIIKNSSVALTISLVELTARTQAMREFTFQTFEAYTAATTIYVMVTLIVVFSMRWVERKVAVPGLISAGGAPMAGH